MKNFISLLRVKSWVKNGFLFLPAVFSLHLFEKPALYSLIAGALTFCFASSFIYILNDLKDAKEDAMHPRKSKRPIASGAVSKSFALTVALLLLGLVLAAYWIFHFPFAYFAVVCVYLFLNLAYTFGLKNLPLVELIIVSVNFVLRVLAGCFLLMVTPSQWILVVTFFLSFLLVVVKRRSEIKQLRENASLHRQALQAYSVPFLNSLVYISSTITISAYLLYSIDAQVVKALKTDKIMYSTLFVLLGIFRLIQITEHDLYEGEGDPTTLLFKDRFLQLIILSWVSYLICILYVF